MLREYGTDRDPLKAVDILEAMRWGQKAWEFDMTALVMYGVA